jgi:hypothetical protein
MYKDEFVCLFYIHFQTVAPISIKFVTTAEDVPGEVLGTYINGTGAIVQTRNIGFLSRSDFIIFRYSAANSGLSRKYRFRLQHPGPVN